MTIGVLKEPSEETRVSFLPEAVTALTKKGITVFVEPGAGEKAFYNDDEYVKAGAVIKSRAEVVQSSDILVAIHPFPEAATGDVSEPAGSACISASRARPKSRTFVGPAAVRKMFFGFRSR